jgi:hypothetical protein
MAMDAENVNRHCLTYIFAFVKGSLTAQHAGIQIQGPSAVPWLREGLQRVEV